MLGVSDSLLQLKLNVLRQLQAITCDLQGMGNNEDLM